jgi:hypothetical protein
MPEVKMGKTYSLGLPFLFPYFKAYDLTYQTQYYDSFSYRSEIRVLKDMAFIDLITLDKERIKLQLVGLSKVRSRFKEFWG